MERARHRAQSGDVGPVYALCSLIDSRSFVGNLPILLKFLSEYNPPADLHFKPEDHLDPTTDYIALARHILWHIALGLQPKLFSIQIPNLQYVLPPIRRSWSAIYKWVSFLVKSFAESDIHFYGELQDDIGSSTVRIVVSLLGYLLADQIIRPQEIQSTPGAGELIVRVHIYSLIVRSMRPALPLYDGKELIPAQQSAQSVASAMRRQWNFWYGIHKNALDKLGQTKSVVAAIIRTLIHLSRQRPLDYSMMNSWFNIFRSGAESKELHKELLHLQSISHVIKIIRHLSKLVSHPTTGGDAFGNPFVLGTCYVAMEYICDSIQYAGYTIIIATLKSGVLQAVWDISQACDIYPMPSRPKLAITAQNLYLNLSEVIGGSAMYRSVQKPLTKMLVRAPFAEINIDSDIPDPGRPSLEVWVKFKRACLSRIELRQHLESHHNLCSNEKCSGVHKYYQCSGCKIAFYCGTNCQKYHWRHGHREQCRKHIKDCKVHHLPPLAKDLDRKLLHSFILNIELWHLRDIHLKMQSARLDKLHSSSTSHDSPIVSFVDLHSHSPKREAWTIDEAKANMPGIDWDQKVKEYHEDLHGRDPDTAGPLVVIVIPSPRHALYLPAVLAKPVVSESEGDDGTGSTKE